jgi:hypothetical protein
VAPGPALVLFEAATLLFWAEQVAGERMIPAEVVPAPPGGGDLCGLALRVAPSQLRALESALEDEGIPFLVHAPPTRP